LEGNVSSYQQGHGANRVTGSVKKKGGNKGIALVKKQRKRLEAEERNAKTKPENRRAFREGRS
jgi:hypothetical protein